MLKPRLVLAGANSGVGKTSVSAGLMAALCRKGLTVQPYKVGPDYIDPSFHTFVTGRQSRNLDSWLLNAEAIKHLFLKNTPEVSNSLSIIEGVMGLFDGHTQGPAGSTAHVAGILKAPVVLIIDGSGIARSAAALVHGYNNFMPNLKISGVIINMVSGEAHYNLLKKYIEDDAQVPCFGYLKKSKDITLDSRHLGLIPSAEVADLSERLTNLATAATDTLDLDGLIKLASSAPPLEPIKAEKIKVNNLKTKIKIAVAQDLAFSFYYQDSLDLLIKYGAELIPISPLNDSSWPDEVAGFYIGGGFPEIFATQLAANRPFKKDLLIALNNGMPTYAECGGLMYLCRELVDAEGQAHEMVGFFTEHAEMTSQLQNFGYITVHFNQDTILGPAGTEIRGHEFHHSKISETSTQYAFSIIKSPTRSWRGGLIKNKTLAGYPHLHFWSNPKLAEYFVDECRTYSTSKPIHI